VWVLVDATRLDPLAPFAMHSSKSYHFNTGKTAAIAYRTRLGVAVVSGDPIGDSTQFGELVVDFVRMCRSRGWRIIVLAGGERHVKLWRSETVGQPMLTVPIGRDVVVDLRRFTLRGRRYRNLRQAVQRTHNCGVTTEIVDEQELSDVLTAELTEVLYAAHRAARTERGFCMNLDGALQGRLPGIKLAIARDRGGRVAAFHRYATAGEGSEVSLDMPFRRPDAPNGVDERLSVDMIAAAKKHQAVRLSLAFAAFPEIFDAAHPRLLQRVAYRLIHLLDPLIRLESLYRYLRKYHSLAERRYVVLSAHHIPAALMVLLSLEFLPRPRHLRRTQPGVA
ncbi:MAG TPA: phosphatidylglycerol lysyltransferase domain-containing protein, partial [Mycobacterium sp.]|nr:phosphatidylglycerol lysyltransferase domain-containing protein [Mycobacterium sp.]